MRLYPLLSLAFLLSVALLSTSGAQSNLGLSWPIVTKNSFDYAIQTSDFSTPASSGSFIVLIGSSLPHSYLTESSAAQRRLCGDRKRGRSGHQLWQEYFPQGKSKWFIDG